ncbi:MAG: anti-sigma regulatory factor [Myxococcales bacterium]|nr:anti-sigma regulatory factor [Myxococcales bacterium]
MSNAIEGLLKIDTEGDILIARKTAREACQRIGFGITDTTRIVTAVSELSRNIFHYAKAGTMHWSETEMGRRKGIELTFSDDGPGIDDINRAMEVGFTTSSTPSLGLGLPGVKRLMDEMEISSPVGKGTTVTVRKWLR